MKTNGLANPANPGITTNQNDPGNTGNIQKLSDRAFYLIALATLLQESRKTGKLQELLVPETTTPRPYQSVIV